MVTTAQIQEALWHYFYDIDKSVAYLVTKHIASPKAAKSAPTQKNKGEGKSKVQFSSPIPYDIHGLAKSPLEPEQIFTSACAYGGNALAHTSRLVTG